MKRIICTITFGFSLGLLICLFFNKMNSFQGEAKVGHFRQDTDRDGAIFFSNGEKIVGEGEGGLFAASPLMEDGIMENELQDI